MKQRLLERLESICKELDPHARLIPFGSLVTGFATTSSDIDCVYAGDIEKTVPAATSRAEMPSVEPLSFPEVLQKRLEDEGFSTTLLTRTRIPIIKLAQKPTELHPVEMQCDIGFKNQLAIHNTHLLQSYALCDSRVKPMVLFVKV
jgi:DNA polymerase sigma